MACGILSRRLTHSLSHTLTRMRLHWLKDGCGVSCTCLAPPPSHRRLCPSVASPSGSLVHFDGERPSATFIEPCRGTRKMAIKGSSPGGAKCRGKSRGQGCGGPSACPRDISGHVSWAPLCTVLTGAANHTPGTHSLCTSERMRVACVCLSVSVWGVCKPGPGVRRWPSQVALGPSSQGWPREHVSCMVMAQGPLLEGPQASFNVLLSPS